MNSVVWLVVLGLIGVNALYVAAEFAAVSARHSQVRQLAQAGNGTASRLFPILSDTAALDRYIAACQIGITLSSLILGAFGQATLAVGLADFLGRAASLTEASALAAGALVTLIALTTLQVVFGELVPKSLALQFPTRVCMLTFWPMQVSLWIYRPLSWVLNGSGLWLMHRLGARDEGGHRHIHSPEEIELLIAESADGGLLEADEQDRLRHALQLSRRTARQLMVPRRQVVMLDAKRPLAELIEAAIESPYTRLPIYRESIDDVIGLLHTKDLALRAARRAQSPHENDGHEETGLSIETLLRPVTSVPDTMTGDTLLRVLRERRSRLVLVMDEFGGVEGLVSLEDVLDELLGEVGDEFKDADATPQRLEDGRIAFPGAWRPDETGPFLGHFWPDDEADTLAGLVITRSGRLPETGETVEIDGVEFTIESSDGRTISRLLARPIAPATNASTTPTADTESHRVPPDSTTTSAASPDTTTSATASTANRRPSSPTPGGRA